MPNHILRIRELGPIKECTLSVKQFTVLTGPQSNGKSTIAKAVYFFRTVKQDILNIMMQGGPIPTTGHNTATWDYILKQRMRDKFLQLFGTSWIMPDSMEMEYSYTEKYWVRVFLRPDWSSEGKNFIDFEFSQSFQYYLDDLNNRSFVNISISQKEAAERELSKKLDDEYETIFIPAGRNLITLLSTQLNYIFTSLEGTQLRNIDFVTKRYTELILKLKPMFEDGMSGVISNIEIIPERKKQYDKHHVAVNMLREAAERVLRGTYRCVDGEERLYLDSVRYIKINFSSSGQQEIVWVFNILLYYLAEGRKVFLILEEPESHLYPDSQQIIGEILALFQNEGNQVLITTHSPYLLGTFNYLLLAGQVDLSKQDAAKKILHKRYWLCPDIISAYHVHNGQMQEAVENEDSLVLINNALIDGASRQINEISDQVLSLIDTNDDIEVYNEYK